MVPSESRSRRRSPPRLKKPEQEPDSAEFRRRLASIPGVILGKPGKPKGARKLTRVRKGQKSVAEIVIADRKWILYLETGGVSSGADTYPIRMSRHDLGERIRRIVDMARTAQGRPRRSHHL